MLDQDLLKEVESAGSVEDFYSHEPLAVDFETTGLKKHPSNALTLSMVIADDQLPIEKRPKLNLLFLHTPENIQDVAIAMNAHIFAARAFCKMKKPEDKSRVAKLFIKEIVTKAEQICAEYIPVADWTEAQEKIDDFLNLYYGENTPTLLGKNIKSFDRGFFPEEINSYFADDEIDVGDYWYEPADKDRGHTKNPSMEECCRRAGIDTTITHDAYLDNCKTMQLWELGIAKKSRENS